jgi:hypothetical protein
MGYRKPVTQTATIAITTVTSDVVRLGDGLVVGLMMPAAFTGTAISFKGADTPTATPLPIYDSDGNLVSVTVAVDRAYGLSGAEADALAPFPFIYLVSNAAGPAYEVAARSVKVLVK